MRPTQANIRRSGTRSRCRSVTRCSLRCAPLEVRYPPICAPVRSFGMAARTAPNSYSVAFVRQGLLMLPAVHAALCVRPDPTDPALDRAMSVRLVSISGRAFAEQSGFAVGGRGGRSPASPAFGARWVMMAASSPVMQAGKWTSVGNRPGRTATGESASLLLAGVQPRLAANQAPARSATPATNETAARTR